MQVAHQDFVWKMRSDPRITAVFAALWGASPTQSRTIPKKHKCIVMPACHFSIVILCCCHAVHGCVGVPIASGLN